LFADVNRTIEALLKAELPASMASQVAISFVTPDDKFPPNTVSLPVIDLFLYEVHENAELRTVEPLLERSATGAVLRVPPPFHLDCHYLVSAFTQQQSGAEMEEHSVLGAALTALLRYRVLPMSVLRGVLAGKTPPVRAAVARKDAAKTELWQALNRRPRASFYYTLTVPVDAAAAASGAAPVTTLVVGGT
jgi:hypothetical protein